MWLKCKMHVYIMALFIVAPSSGVP
uniref:Uncharacterized protein n=1 Tax=Anguilla anguilla TaxID=7936 RepID=A0A0E9RBY9_ANGAN